MSKTIVTKAIAPTGTKGKRVKAVSDLGCTVVEWDYELTDTANMRKAANQLLFEVNSEPHNAIHRIKWQILAGGLLPNSTEYVFIISD